MSAQTILLIVLLVFVVGIILLGFAAYMFFVLKVLRDLTQSLNRAIEIMKSLTEGVGFGDVLKQVEHATKVAIELGRRTDVLTSTLKMMHEAIFVGKASPNLEVAADTTGASASGFFTSTDADNARREVEKELKKRGIRVSEEDAYHPDEKEGVTAPTEES